MMRPAPAICIVGLLFALPSWAAPNVALLDLTRHAAADKADLKALGVGEYEWSLPSGDSQSLTLDLDALGIDLGRYDELRFEVKPMGSQVGLHTVIDNHPQAGQKSSWYLKFRAPAGQWSEGRYDLHLDDDGVYLGAPAAGGHRLRVELYRRLLGYPGEPRWRKALLRNVRLVRRVVNAEFRLLETELVQDAGEVGCIYRLHVTNAGNEARKALIEPDPDGSLRHFRADCAATELELKPGEERVVTIRLSMPLTQAARLPRLYAEAASPRVSVPGLEDSDVRVLMGYRRWPMWAVVPLFDRRPWQPAEFQALLAAREKAMPGVADLRAGAVSAADAAMAFKWPVPDFGPPIHDQTYRCERCRCWLRPASPTELHKHVCPECGKVFENNDVADRAWLMRYNQARAGDVKALALAWLMTGKGAYAEKAAEILLDYADGYARMPITGDRSTSGAAKLGVNTLHSSYVIPHFAEGYAWLRGASCLDEGKRGRIEGMLRAMGDSVIRHSVEYNNQQAEHLRAYGSVGLATGFWPMAAEAIHGEFGFHEVAEYGYSADGIAHESGAYHRSVFMAMHDFAQFAWGFGIDLFTHRYKRVFDGSLDAGFFGPGTAYYELPYRVYRDPKYLPILAFEGRGRALASALYGVEGLPEAGRMPVESVHMPGAGYLHLRKGTAADWRGVSLNYIKTFDRSENDRFTTFLYHTGRQVDSTVGRITYGSPRGWWMTHTAAHNAIVIDGASERDSEGLLVACDLSPEHPIAVVASDPAGPLYEGVRQLRCIALIRDWYVVFDHVEANRRCTIDRYQYGLPPAKLLFAAKPLEGLPPRVPEAGVFSQMEGGACGREVRVDFGGGLKMRLVSDGDMEGYKGLTVGGYQADPMEFTFARRRDATRAAFLAAFSLGADAEPPALRIVRASAEECVLEVGDAPGAWTLTIRPGQATATVAQGAGAAR